MPRSAPGPDDRRALHQHLAGGGRVLRRQAGDQPQDRALAAAAGAEDADELALVRQVLDEEAHVADRRVLVGQARHCRSSSRCGIRPRAAGRGPSACGSGRRSGPCPPARAAAAGCEASAGLACSVGHRWPSSAAGSVSATLAGRLRERRRVATSAGMRRTAPRRSPRLAAPPSGPGAAGRRRRTGRGTTAAGPRTAGDRWPRPPAESASAPGGYRCGWLRRWAMLMMLPSPPRPSRLDHLGQHDVAEGQPEQQPQGIEDARHGQGDQHLDDDLPALAPRV